MSCRYVVARLSLRSTGPALRAQRAKILSGGNPVRFLDPENGDDLIKFDCLSLGLLNSRIGFLDQRRVMLSHSIEGIRSQNRQSTSGGVLWDWVD